MKKALLVLAVSGIVFFANDTYAGNNNSNGGCQGNCPTSGGGGATEVNVDNTVTNNNIKVNNSTRSNDSNAVSLAAGGDGGNVGNIKTTSKSTGGSVGDTSATGGNVGNTTATGGNSGDSTSTAVGGRSFAAGGKGGKGGKGGAGGSATGGSVGDTTSTANVGDTSSTVGDTTSQSNNDNTSSVGNTTSESNNSNDSAGGDVEFNYTQVDAENVASSAASVLTGFCQTGGSGQGTQGGFSLVGNDLFCDRIRMADYYWVQYERQVQLAVTFKCANPSPALESRCAKTGERMLTSLDKAWSNTEKANSLLNSGEFSAKVEKAVGPFARIGGILSVLLLL